MSVTTAPAPPGIPSPAAPQASAPAIVTEGLTKRFSGDRLAVRDLSISVPRGVVAGFVGPNGSGKTTTIRMLLGLVAPSAGSARMLGESITQPGRYLHNVGALIEAPAFYPSLSGRTNLSILSRLGGHDPARIPGLLELVGLSDRAGDRVSRYSLGMKQRLGIAATLLSDPTLLILDEPVNGLDPPGIIEVRDLLRRLREQGKTIFVSSHLLAEVEQVADWLVMLKDGRSLYCGPADEVPGRGSGTLVVVPERADQLATLAGIVRTHGHAVVPRSGSLQVTAPPSFAGVLNREAMAAGITLVELHRSQASLEQTFLTMIDGEQ